MFRRLRHSSYSIVNAEPIPHWSGRYAASLYMWHISLMSVWRHTQTMNHFVNGTDGIYPVECRQLTRFIDGRLSQLNSGDYCEIVWLQHVAAKATIDV